MSGGSNEVLLKKTSLTEKEASELEAYKAEIWAIANRVDEADWETAEQTIFKMYDLIGRERPKFVFRGTPVTCVLAINGLKDRSSLGRSLWNSLRRSLRRSLGGSIRRSLRGNQDLYWVAFYEFCGRLNLVNYSREDMEKLRLWRKIGESISWWWPYENWLFLADRPSSVKWLAETPGSVLHSDGSPSVEYRDGWKLWNLHGVSVPQWLAETPGKEIDPRKLYEIKNTDVRREFVRKVGIERIVSCPETGKVVK